MTNNKTREELLKYFRANPDLIPIIEAALEHERNHKDKEYYYGWTWDDIRASPQKLKKLFLDKIIDRKYQSNRYTSYILKPEYDFTSILIELFDTEYRQEQGEFRPIEIPDDLFDIIVGHDDVKDVLKTTLKAPKPAHFILVGRPGTAKSLFLNELARLDRNEFVLGGTSTKIGLFDLLFESEPRLFLLDELDKTHKPHLSILLSLCQEGRIKRVKHGSVEEKKLDTIVIATANKIDKLPEEVLNRFGILHFDKYTKEETKKVIFNILTKHEGIDSNLANQIGKIVVDEMGSVEVRDAVRLSRLGKDLDQIMKAAATLKKRDGRGSDN